MRVSLPSQFVLSNLPSHCCLFFATSVSFSRKNHNPSSRSIAFPSHFRIVHWHPKICINFKSVPYSLQAHESDSAASSSTPIVDSYRVFDFDGFLSFAEVVCIVSSAVVSVGFAANYSVIELKNEILGEMWRRVLLCGVAWLVGGVAIGAWIRRRQCKRICRDSVRGERLNLLKRIEKLEEELSNSATIIRVLSRHLEKLGTRFRITKNALKQAITETAALAQKNSEATRALAIQEDILEKEIRETQKVLLAMQEQQQKQLNLILTVAKNSQLWESEERSRKPNDRTRSYNTSSEVKQAEKQTAQVTDVTMETDTEVISDSATTNPV